MLVLIRMSPTVLFLLASTTPLRTSILHFRFPFASYYLFVAATGMPPRYEKKKPSLPRGPSSLSTCWFETENNGRVELEQAE